MGCKSGCSEGNTEIEYQCSVAPAKLRLNADNCKCYKIIDHTSADYACG
jgi:hypothetical protein